MGASKSLPGRASASLPTPWLPRKVGILGRDVPRRKRRRSRVAVITEDAKARHLREKLCVICGSGSSGQWKTGELMADPTCMGVKKQKGFLRRTIFVIVWSCLRVLVSYLLIKEPLLPA